MADLTADGVVITAIDGTPRERAVHTIDWDIEAAEKGGYPHFMLKEMHEQPQAIRSAIAGRIQDDAIVLDELIPLADRLREVERIELVACGSAHYASSVAAYLFQEWTGLPARSTVGSEFRYSPPPLDGRTLVIAVTQSGETADTIAPTRLRPGARLPGHRRHQHGRLGDHPRGGRGPLPAGRAGDRGGGHQDVRDPGHHARDAGRRDRQGPRQPRRGSRARAGRTRCGRCPTRPSGRSRWPRRRGPWRAATSTRAASCSSAAASATRWRSRAPSSSRRSATSTPRATRPAS